MRKSKKDSVVVSAESIVEVMEKLIDLAHSQLKDLIDSNELDVYLRDETEINEKKVDYSDDITPAQVAVLGAYTVTVKLKKDLKLAKAGKPLPALKKEKKEKKTTKTSKKSKFEVEAKVAVFDRKNGKSRMLTKDELDEIPPEVRSALRDLLDKMEN